MACILIIEDDDQFRTWLCKVLEKEGHTVEGAADGSAGLKRFHQQSFDLVITDLIMPNKEGIETIVDLKVIHPAAKIIAISGGGRNHPKPYLEIAEKLGANRTIEKPFERDQLLFAVEALT